MNEEKNDKNKKDDSQATPEVTEKNIPEESAEIKPEAPPEAPTPPKNIPEESAEIKPKTPPEAPTPQLPPEAPVVPKQPLATEAPVAGTEPPIIENPEGKSGIPFFKKHITPIIVGAVALVLVLLAMFFTMSKTATKQDDSLLIEPITSESFMEDGTTFIQGLEKFSLEDVKANLVFEPKVDFEVTESGKGFAVTMSGQRNIAYAGTFSYIDSEGMPRQEVFMINGPDLTVALKAKEMERYEPIVLTFSEQVDVRSFEENMTLTPATPVYIEYDLDTVMIYPETEWQLTSQYSLQINNTYASKNGKELVYNRAFSLIVVKPESEGGGRYYPEAIFHNDDNFIISEGINLVLSFTGQSLKENLPVIINTYSLGDVEKFKTQSKIYLEYDVALDSLEKIDSNAFEIVEGENRFEIKNPGAGTYLVTATHPDPNSQGKEIMVRTGYLVTPYSLYMQSSKNETLVWLHNGTESAPSQNYRVVFDGDEERSGTTDEQGISIIPNPAPPQVEESEAEYYSYRNERGTNPAEISVYDDKNQLVYYDDAKLRSSSGRLVDLYYSYLFLDRSLYRPEDTIQFWGYVKPFRTNKNGTPETVDIVFDEGGLNLVNTVKVDPSGFFTGEIALENIRSSNYYLNASFILPKDEEIGRMEDTQVSIGNQYINVKQFQKPSYIIETKVDKDYYRAGETVTVTTTPTFYDGTPLPNFTLEVFYKNFDYSGEWTPLENITTNNDGVASFSFTMPTPSSDYSYTNSTMGSYMVQIASDGEQIKKIGNYNAVIIETLTEQIITKQPDGKNLQLEIKTYELDLEAPAFKSYITKELQNDDEWGWAWYSAFNTEKLLELAKGKPKEVSGNISFLWEYEDANKIVHENRRYNPREEYVFYNSYSLDYQLVEPSTMEIIDDWETMEKRLSFKTENGSCLITDVIHLPEGSAIDFSKDVKLRSKMTIDSNDYARTYTAYYPSTAEYYDWNYWYDDDNAAVKNTLSFKVTDKDSGKDLTPSASYYRNVKLNVGAPTNFQLMLDSEPVTRDGTILYTIIQGGLYEYKVVKANEFTMAMETEFSPNAQIVAAYFDGSRSHYISTVDISASDESLTISIDVTADKEQYRPGDTVNLDINSTDYKGDGVAGNICVAVVDESLFAIEEQYIDVLNDLYSSLWYMDNYVSRYCTTYRSGGANTALWSGGKGDGDGGEFYDSYRANFKDTASFVTTTTDSNGSGKITFTLPDNTTSWRITAVEIGDNMTAGSGKTNIISTLPFFVKPVTSSKYIDGDEISMLVQGHGKILGENSKIDYEVTLEGNGFNKTLKHSSVAYQPLEFNFGKLPVGSYKLMSKATFDGYSDTVEIPVHVIKSNLELVVNKPLTVKTNEPLDINAVRFPVSLTIYDKNVMPFMQSIDSLFGHYCMMPSQRLSRFTAKRVLKDSLADPSEIPYYIAKGNDSVADMQQSDGGIGDSAGAESELFLSTYLAQIATDQFDHTTLAGYFDGQIATVKTDKEKAAAYLGLAAIKSTDAKQVLKMMGRDEKGKVVDEKIKLNIDSEAYYIAALAYLGEDSLAKDLYNSQLKGFLTDLDAHKNTGYLAFNENDLSWERDAAAVWVASSLIDQEDANRFSVHFAQHSWRYLTLFEAMVYVTNYHEPLKQQSYSYTIGGVSTTNTLGLTGMSTLALNRDQLETLRFTSMPNTVAVSAYYVGEPSELDIVPSDKISVEKTVTSMDNNTYKVSISLELSAGAPAGMYDISDWIPSNARLYESYKRVGDDYSTSMRTENQKVYIEYRHAGKPITKTFSYTIRQTYSSSAMLDSIYVIHGGSGVNCSSEKELFTPENPNISTPVVHIDPSKVKEKAPE